MASEVAEKGYVLKNQAGSDLLQALRQVSRVQVYLSPGVAQAMVESDQSSTGKSGRHLTVRERQASAEVDCGGKIDEGYLGGAGNQRKDGGIAPDAADREAGYS